MNSHSRRREAQPDPFKQWIPADRYPPDYDADRRRNRSATLPAHSYDPRSYPSNDARYHEPRQSSRSHRQDPHHSYHHSSAHTPSTSKAYQHATRSSAHHSSAAHQYPQPPSYHPSHPTTAYPAASSSRRPHPEASDPRSSRRPTYDHVSGGEDMPRASARPHRAPHPSIQPSISAPPNQTFWNPPQDTSSRRYKDAYRDRDRDQERERVRERDKERDRERERDRPTTEPETRYKDRTKAERYREREPERATDARHQDSGRPKHHDRRKGSDTEGVQYLEQRNASKASLSGREGPSTVREPTGGHKRHRTEDGTASTGRRYQPENTQNSITTMTSHSTAVPQSDVQQTGEPPPAPRVMPVYLPPKAKPQRSQRDGRPSAVQGVQSGSDTERVTAKHRMERTPSGPAVQRIDAHTSTSTRDRSNHDLSMGTRDDVKRLEGKYGAHQDTRQPLAPINVDIPLVTPGFNASALPAETRASSVSQIVSIRAGQGPSDPHDAHFKSSVVSHSNAPQEIATHHPHPTSASIVKPSGHTRSQPSETRAQLDRPPAVVDCSRTEPHAGDLPAGQRMSVHESSRALPTTITRPPYSRGNTETGADITGSSHPHSRPPSRSAHRNTNSAVPPPVIGPRAQRSVSHGPQTNEPPTRPPSDIYHSVPPSPAQPRAGHTHSSSSSAQPSPKHGQLHGISPNHSAQPAPSVAPSAHPTPISASQILAASSRPSTRDGTHQDMPHAHQRSADQRSTTDNNSESRQTSNSTTIKASWVVQTPATAKKARISREDKYLRDYHLNLDTPQAQLRQVLSQDDDPFPRASSSMMKASQAATPLTSSQRSSFGTRSRDASLGTPRGTSGNNSPRSAKEMPIPEHMSRQNLLPYSAGPPQIAVVGATPISMASDLPQSRVDHALLVPPFSAPPRASRSTSGSQDHRSQPSPPTGRDSTLLPPYPQLAPAVHAPSLFQPYQPPSPPVAEHNGQFSPPPLPIPPPRCPEDSPPPAIETRMSEIIPTRSQSDNHPPNVPSVPEVQSEMILLPSSSPHLASSPPARAAEAWQTGKAVPPGDIQIVHEEIIRSTSVIPSQSSTPPARPRPKVTIEEVPEDSPVLSKAFPSSVPATTPLVSESRPGQSPQHATSTNTNVMSKPAVMDQPGHKPSPQSRSRNTEPGAVPVAPPMPSPSPAVAPTSTRVPLSTPAAQPTFPPFSQAVPVQRTTSNTVPSRTYQRAAEMLQASKLSSAGTNASTAGNVNKSASAPTQTPVGAATSHQLANAQGTSTAMVDAPTTPYPTPIATISVTKVAAPVMTTSSGAQGLHTLAPSTSDNPRPASVSHALKSRPEPLSIPSLDITPMTVMSTTSIDTTRPRDVPSATRHPPSSHIYPMSSSPMPSSAMTQQTHVTQAQPPTHYRAVSLPLTTPSSAVQKPPSPRKYSQPITSTIVSTQPFPSRPPPHEPQSARVPAPGNAPGRPARPSGSNYTNDPDMLKTPSSIAPSPMLNPDTSNVVSQSTRPRQVSTESKDEKKKGLFGLFRTRTLSSKATNPPPVSSVPRASADQARAQPDAPVAVSTTVPVPRGAMSTSAPKVSHPFPQPVTSTSTRTGMQTRSKGRVHEPATTPHPTTQTTREHRDATPHIFKFLSMNSKRNRTVSAASLDVCDGNTATNTVVGSPDHSALSQVQALPTFIPPDVRDPIVATSEWRDREEAERRERKKHRIRRPGVTFDLEEEPPSPAPGTAKRKRLIRRPSGRAPTPAPQRG